jgi:hypothetical protein
VERQHREEVKDELSPEVALGDLDEVPDARVTVLRLEVEEEL